MNSQYVQELLPVGVRGKQGGKHRCPRRNQWSAGPPDVKVVRRRKRRHGTSLSDAFFSEFRDRQPAFDKARVRHPVPPRS